MTVTVAIGRAVAPTRIPLGRLVAHHPIPLGRSAGLSAATVSALTASQVTAFVDTYGHLWVWDGAAFVRHVRTAEGARRWGVPIGSPIPTGRRTPGGHDGGNHRVQLAPKDRAAAQRAFGPPGSANKHGASINDRGELEINDPDKAAARLDAIAADESMPQADRERAENLEHRVDQLPRADRPDNSGTGSGGSDSPSAPAPAPNPAPATPAPPASAPTPAAPTVDLADADRAMAEQAFGGPDDHGARITDDGRLEVHDPERANQRLDDLADDFTDADYDRATELQDKLHELPSVEEQAAASRGDVTGADLSRDYADRVTLSDSEKSAITSYTGAGYGGINSTLRGQDTTGQVLTDPAEIRAQTDAINAAMARYTTPQQFTAYRSIYGDSGLPDGDITGQVITSPGFSSTAVGKPAPGYSDGENHMEITVPPGMNGLDVAGSGAGAFGGDEREFVLPHNTRFRVDSVTYRDRDGTRQRVLKVTALPPAAASVTDLPEAA